MSLSSVIAAVSRPASTAGWLGVVRDPAQAVAAALSRDGQGRPRLHTLHSAQGADALITLVRWRRRQGLRRWRANLLLDSSDYQILPMDLPEVAAGEVADAMRWRIKDMIEYPAEEARLACLALPSANGSGHARQALVVVARAVTVGDRMRAARQAGLDLHAIDAPELALRNLALLTTPEGGASALLHVGVARSTLVMVWQGELCSMRRFELRAHQLLAAEPFAFDQLIERLGQDVQRSTDAFERQFHAAALGRLWVVDEQPGLAIAEPLARQLTLQVRPMKLAEWITIDSAQAPLMDAIAGIDFVPAIGAALREETAT